MHLIIVTHEEYNKPCINAEIINVTLNGPYLKQQAFSDRSNILHKSYINREISARHVMKMLRCSNSLFPSANH
jgi:hypothetical protein